MRDEGKIFSIDRMFLVVTNWCNASCKLCHYHDKTPKRHLSLEFIQKKIIPLISKYYVRLVLITGGEPTLHPQLPQILECLKSTYVDIAFITNGTGLTHHWESIAPYVDSFMFSLDAADPKTHREIRGLDNFNAILQWPEKIKAQEVWTQIAFLCLLQKKNIHQLVDIYRLVSQLPGDALIFNVPELKPHCFGRDAVTPRISTENTLLNDEEFELLKKKFQQIKELDHQNLVFQSEGFFEKCLTYFKAIRENATETTIFNNPEKICRVPFNSLVIHEDQQISPCFYLPYSVPFQQLQEEDPFNDPALIDFRREMAANSQFRQSHCRFCLQFQS